MKARKNIWPQTPVLVSSLDLKLEVVCFHASFALIAEEKRSMKSLAKGLKFGSISLFRYDCVSERV